MLKVDTSNATCPDGFAAHGVACGTKASGAADLALIVAEQPVPCAAMFTRNLVRAAPVEISARHLAASAGRVRAVIISSGCANAATGAEGFRRAERAISALAGRLGCPATSVLMNSTGVIGEQLPEEKIIAAIPEVVDDAKADGLSRAARAMMTTDTRPKMVQVHGTHEGRTFRVAGIAKGSGMIHPNMATMIALLLTDAAMDPPSLDRAMRCSVERSFHRISVDGDTSTNDSVFALASGKAGQVPAEAVEQAMTAAARELALMIVKDGEGASKLIHVQVKEARTPADALRVAQTVAGSMLVRTAVAGGDPNWGRIIAAAGRSGVEIDPQQLAVFANDVPLFANGAPVATPWSQQQRAFAQPLVVLELRLGQGGAEDEFFTCDLTEGYVRINSHYKT